MQLFRAEKKIFFKSFFDPEKVKKRASKVAHNRPKPLYFTVQPRPLAHSPELIFHVMKSRDQTSVLLSVVGLRDPSSPFFNIRLSVLCKWGTLPCTNTPRSPS